MGRIPSKILEKRTQITLGCLVAAVLLRGRSQTVGPSCRHDEPHGRLPGSRLLTTQGDMASGLVAGINQFLLRLDESARDRATFWRRDVSSREKYAASEEPNRERLVRIRCVRDPRVSFDARELAGFPAR